MTFIITQRCCDDAACVATCPTDCIRPTPDQPEFATAEMLFIDPQACIDCGACAVVCPTSAIYPEDDLPEELSAYREINAEYFQRNPLTPNYDVAATPEPLPAGLPRLRVAIVGAGPAALYAAEELLRRARAEVTIFDRLPTIGGLIRAGVAPDHGETRGVIDTLAKALDDDSVRFCLNTEVGRDISHAELLDHHHAVIYAVGASTDRRLGIPGEDLPGSHSATEFVGWYNGHPDYADHAFDLSGERAVIIGNGNVALDIARVLTLDPEFLARTDIADHALKALRESTIREVVVLGRRGPAQAAYTSSELLALSALPGVDVVVEPALTADTATDLATARKLALVEEFSHRTADPAHKRIVLRYLASPLTFDGDDRLSGVTIVRNELTDRDGVTVARPTGETDFLPAGLALRSVGYRGTPLPDIPFDEQSGRVPNASGRVLAADGTPLPGTFVTGWIKRGPNGVIGTNRLDSRETVDTLLTDFRTGALPTPTRTRHALAQLLTRHPHLVDRPGWESIDRAERAAGAITGRPRVKLTRTDDLLAAAQL